MNNKEIIGNYAIDMNSSVYLGHSALLFACRIGSEISIASLLSREDVDITDLNFNGNMNAISVCFFNGQHKCLEIVLDRCHNLDMSAIGSMLLVSGFGIINSECCHVMCLHRKINLWSDNFNSFIEESGELSSPGILRLLNYRHARLLLVLLSVRVIGRLGNHSTIKKLPHDIIRMLLNYF